MFNKNKRITGTGNKIRRRDIVVVFFIFVLIASVNAVSGQDISPGLAKQVAKYYGEQTWGEVKIGSPTLFYDLDGIPAVFVFEVLKNESVTGTVVVGATESHTAIVEMHKGPPLHVSNLNKTKETAISALGTVDDNPTYLYPQPFDYWVKYSNGTNFITISLASGKVISLNSTDIIKSSKPFYRKTAHKEKIEKYWKEIKNNLNASNTTNESTKIGAGDIDTNENSVTGDFCTAATATCVPNYGVMDYYFPNNDGCAPMSSGMILDYWDDNGYDNLITNNYTADNIIDNLAIQMNTDGNGETYMECVPIGINLACTSSTACSNGGGIRAVVISRGYNNFNVNIGCDCWHTDANWWCDITDDFNNVLVNEINNNRPVVYEVSRYVDRGGGVHGGHAMAAIGYDTNGGNFVIVHDPNYNGQSRMNYDESTEHQYATITPPDMTPPTQSGHNPANGSAIATTSPAITFNTNENADCKWSLSDQKYGNMTGDCSGDGTTSQSCTVSGLNNDSVIVYIACKSTAGNEDTALTNEHIYYVIDIAPPAIQFVSPTTSSGNLSQNYINANVTANDTRLANITVRLYNSTGLRSSITCASSPCFANFTGLPDGIYSLNATANDTVGNRNSTETRIINYWVDTDGDGIRDMYDVCPSDRNNDVDVDGYCAGSGFTAPKIGGNDNCPEVNNSNQLNWDNDSFGDACDPDVDGDGVTNEDDYCSFTPLGESVEGYGTYRGCSCSQKDDDGDGVSNCNDNCLSVSNSNQSNRDNDSYGDACDFPDLVVSAVNFNKINLTGGENVTINVTVKNIGTDPANNVLINVLGVNKDVNSVIYSGNGSVNLSNNSDVVIQFNWTVVVGIKITAKADPNNTIIEFDEGNNEKSKTVFRTCDLNKNGINLNLI